MTSLSENDWALLRDAFRTWSGSFDETPDMPKEFYVNPVDEYGQPLFDDYREMVWRVELQMMWKKKCEEARREKEAAKEGS